MAATNGQFWSQVFLKADGTPYQGIQCDHWVAGGTITNLDVYQEANLAAAHNNPVIGDNSGRVSFYGNGTYRLRIRTSAADGNITLYDWDHVEILHHTATLRAEDRALSLPSASAASRGRLFGVVDGGGDLTSLWIQRTAAIWMQLLTLPTLSQMLEFNKGTDIASTTSVTIPDNGNFFDITGTNDIESFSSFTGYPLIFTRFVSGGLTLVNNSVTFTLRTGVSRVVFAGEVVAWLQVASGRWVELFSTRDWMPAAGGTGLPTLPAGALFSGNGLLPMQSSGAGEIYQALTSGATGAPIWSYGLAYHGPASIGSGSTRTHEGIVNINANTSLFGIHYYTDFTLASGVTITVPANGRRLVIIASRTITINGTIAANGGGVGGGVGGAGVAGGGNLGTQGAAGTDQPGGAGGQSAGTAGDVVFHGVVIGAASTQIAGSSLPLIAAPWGAMGGSGGGGGRGGTTAGFPGGAGGRAGASLVLIAPTIVLANTATLNTSGLNGAAASGSGSSPGGGGGAGNIFITARSFTDNGATFAQTGGGSGSLGGGGGSAGGAGADGVKQVMLYG